MIFTKSEKELLVKNTNQIFEYISKNISPFLKAPYVCGFEDNPSYYKLNIRIYPTNNGFNEIKLYRNSLNSTKYKLGKKYDDEYTQKQNYKDFFNDHDVMYHLIRNWKNIKEELLKEVDEVKQTKELIENFQV